MKLSFYVSGKASRLKRIIELNHEVLQQTVVVITDSVDALSLADDLSDLGISLKYFDYRRHKASGVDTNLFLSDFILKHFLDHQVDYCFCFGDHILKGELLEVFHKRIINFHPSILPLFPGRKAIDQALASSSTILLGNTAHFIDSGVDTGPIIMQSIVSKDYFYEFGYEGILDIQIPMLSRIHHWLMHGAFPQDGTHADYLNNTNKVSFFNLPNYDA